MRKPTKEPQRKSLRIEFKEFTSVTDLVRELGPQEFADEFDKHLAARTLIRSLTLMRGLNELTQGELAEKMKCAVENLQDGELSRRGFEFR